MANEQNNPNAEGKQPEQKVQGGNPDKKNIANDVATFLDLMKTLVSQNVGPNRLVQSAGEAVKEAENKLKNDLDETLQKKEPVTVAFPPCADVMLSLIKCNNYEQSPSDSAWIAPITNENESIAKMFLDYFGFVSTDKRAFKSQERHEMLSIPNADMLDAGWKSLYEMKNWPPAWCLPASYVTLKGQRHFYFRKDDKGTFLFKTAKRLFLADVVWLFYMERMGVFQILAKILDEYAYYGGFPISNGSANPKEPKDDLLALVLEAMTRQMEMGTASKVRDRTALYRTALGWTQDNGRNLGVETTVNTAFNTQFHKFIYLALQYYKDKRIKDAIQASSSNATNSGATMVSIRSTMNLLKKSFDNFHYGRNYYNTLSGIVWTVAAFAVIRDIRETIGIPTQYNEPYEYIPEMYERLVSKSTVKTSGVNRFETHFECATNARDILIDIELLETSSTDADNQQIESWLSIIEPKVEGYRSAYRALTGKDLGADLVTTQEPMIEQQV